MPVHPSPLRLQGLYRLRKKIFFFLIFKVIAATQFIQPSLRLEIHFATEDGSIGIGSGLAAFVAAEVASFLKGNSKIEVPRQSEFHSKLGRIGTNSCFHCFNP